MGGRGSCWIVASPALRVHVHRGAVAGAEGARGAGAALRAACVLAEPDDGAARPASRARVGPRRAPGRLLLWRAMNRVTRTSVGRCDRARGRGDRRITRSAALERERRRVAAAAAGPGGVEGTGAALHVPQATRLGPQGRKRCAARRICGC